MNTAFYDFGNQFRNDNQKADIKIEKWHHMKTTSSWNMKQCQMRTQAIMKRHEKELTTSNKNKMWNWKWHRMANNMTRKRQQIEQRNDIA